MSHEKKKHSVSYFCEWHRTKYIINDERAILYIIICTISISLGEYIPLLWLNENL